jgi:hypothetical protein
MAAGAVIVVNHVRAPNCGPVGKEIVKKSREEEWRRGEENDCPCADCREFARTHGKPEKNLAMKDTGKENQKFAQSSDPKSDGNGVQKPSKRVRLSTLPLVRCG